MAGFLLTNAALCLLLAAVALVLVALGPGSRVRRTISRVLAAVVMTVGSLTFLEHILGINFGIDQFLAHEPPGALGILHPNRMGPPGAITYATGGLSLLLLLRRNERSVRAAQWLAIMICIVAMLGILGYFYSIKGLYGAARFTVIALPATIGNLLFGIGLLCARPRDGIMAGVTSSDQGSAIVRRLLPAAVLLPILLGWLRLQGEWHGLYELQFGTALLIISWIIIFSILIYKTGAWLRQAAETERLALEEVQTQRQLLDSVVANIPAGIFLARAEDLRIELANQQYKEFAPGKEMVGKTVEEVWPEIQPWFGDIQRRVAATGIPHHAVDDRILLARSHGAALEERYFTWSTVRVPLPEGQEWGVLTTAWETTQRKRTEDELKQARDLLKGILEGTTSYIGAVDTKYRFMAMNSAYRETFSDLFGVEAKIGDCIADLLAHVPEQKATAMSVWQKALQGETFVVEEEFGVPGRSRHFEIRFSPIKDREGTIVGAAQISSDITARKEAEEALRQNEERLRTIFDNAGIGIVEVAEGDRFVAVNDRVCEMLGYARDELLTMDVHRLTSPEDRPLSDEMNRKVHEGVLARAVYDKRYLKRDGSALWVHVSVTGIRDSGGRWIRSITTVEDISERKQAEDALRRSEQKFRAVFEQAAVGIARVSFTDARWMDINEAFYQMLGYTVEEMLATPWPDITHPEDVDLDLVPFRRMAVGELENYSVEKRFIHKDGHHVWARLTLSLVKDVAGNPDYEIAIIENISEYKYAENRLRENEARFRGIFENAAVGISLFDRSGRLMQANDKLCDTLGYQESELKGRSFEDFSFAEDMEPDRSNYRHMMDGELPYYVVEKRYARKDRTLVWVRVTRAVQRGPDDEPQYSINIVEDISARKEAESELHRTAALLRTVTENTPDFIFVKDRQGRMLMANPATLNDLGKPPEEVLGRTDDEFLGGEGALKIMENDRMVMERGETLVLEEIPHPQGDRRVYLSSKSPYLDENGKVIGLIGISRDITDIKRAGEERERLLAEVQRSNQDLQQFAYVASHDLQEPLRMVSSYMQLLERKYRDQLDEKAQKYIHYAVDGTKRMQNLIDGLLRYSRISREKELVPVDTNATYAAAIANLAKAIGEAGGNVTVDLLPTVPGDEIQLVQLFQNLIGNGLKYRKPGSAPKVHVSARQLGEEWIFSVTDDGIGIPPQHFDRIFQIFQRLHTKDEYPGTGIGLASCKKIVERHGGRIWVESEPGKGSTFYFALPAKEPAHEPRD
ncbi:PAS domain S-box protein [Geobacter sp. DSM 9736]|uniref:PAS domain-containing sensor histidine kinase n=1 Tax=Geobacter sp. DSM 9736 TaxID=1277350 RepID=UPI000B50242F|nr:PAS domain S-box protein [Geobacter sp. DSM 9736]SNB45945.1 PAS domain S-box-containing protein [Geobacter sp. DSM 9736]